MVYPPCFTPLVLPRAAFGYGSQPVRGMAGGEVVKAGCPLLEALRSGRVGIVRDERGEVVDLLAEGRGLLGRAGSVEETSKFLWSGWSRLLSSWWPALAGWSES
jgi:hypothetical protein